MTLTMRLTGWDTWMTVTHYYLAQQFHGNVHLQNTIAAFESPSQARQFAYSKNAVCPIL